MKLGYARVSTADQDLRLQRQQLKDTGCEKLFEEKISGTRKKRPELEKLLAELRRNDVLVVTRLDRLARSTSELLRIAEVIEEKSAGLQSLAEPWADTTSPISPISSATLMLANGGAKFMSVNRASALACSTARSRKALLGMVP